MTQLFSFKRPAILERWWPEEDRPVLWATGLWIFFVFASWDLFQVLSGVATGYSLVSPMPSVLSEVSSWLPLAKRVSEGNLFPTLPSVDPQAHGLSFLPYLSLWFHGFWVALLGPVYASVLGHVLIPWACYYLIYAVFRRSLSPLWSAALGFVALISFVPLPFRDFLVGLFTGGFSNLPATAQPLEIAHFPFPAFSLFCFLIGFLLSTENRKLSTRRLAFVTAYWAIQIYVHPINWFFGMAFWFLVFPVRIKRQNPGLGMKLLGQRVVTLLGLALVLVIPAVVAWMDLRHGSGLHLSNFGVYRGEDKSLFEPFYSWVYFVLPVALTLVLYWLARLDPYELVFRFWPVFVFMLIEFTVINGNLLFNFSVSPQLVFSRLGIFFLHFYYLTPALYFLTRRLPTIRGGHSEAPVLKKFRSGVVWFFNEAPKLYLVAVMALLTAFAWTSAGRHFEHQVQVEKPGMDQAQKELGALTAGATAGDLLVSDNPAVNLLLPIASRSATLWVNRFSNEISLEEGIERLALYGRIFQWDEARFLKFMSPGALQDPKRVEPIAMGRDQVADSGVGYWLTQHRARLQTPEEQGAYREQVRRIFAEMDMPRALTRFRVRRILTTLPISKEIPVKSVRTLPEGSLYEL